MKPLAIALLSATALLSACASYPTNPEEQAAFHANLALQAIAEGDKHTAGYQIENSLNRPSGGIKIKELFAKAPKGRAMYYAHLDGRVADIKSADAATLALKKMAAAKTAGLLPDADIDELMAKVNRKVIDGNLSGSLRLQLDENIDAFPALKAPEHHRIIFSRTIQTLQNGPQERRQVAALMRHIEQSGKGSPDWKTVEGLLPTLNIRRDEIDTVATLFPAFGATRRGQMSVPVHLQFKNGDRLSNDDLQRKLREGVLGVEWVNTPSARATTLLIERVRNEEKILPERRQTFTYAFHEVDFLHSALQMPKNASFIYDVVSGGSEIEYGYVVSAIANGKTIHDAVVRGTVGGEYTHCQNSRIQNVFGGVTPAGFVANDDMRRRCGGDNKVSLDALRDEVFSKIVDGVLAVQPIKVSHNLNQ